MFSLQLGNWPMMTRPWWRGTSSGWSSRMTLRRHTSSRCSRPTTSSLSSSTPPGAASSGLVWTSLPTLVTKNSEQPISNEEFRATKINKGFNPHVVKVPTGFHYKNVSTDALPATVDRRTKGAVTPIKNQRWKCNRNWGIHDVLLNNQCCVHIGTMGSRVWQARGPRHVYNLTKGSVVSKIS
jgi:hypothetical protein